jgi:hypothetical protein
MGSNDDFESKFNEIISQENFDEPDFQKIAINEISDTLASMTFSCAQLSNILFEAISCNEIEITAAFMELLKDLKDSTENFNDEVEIEITFDDYEDEEEYDEEEEEPEDGLDKEH